MQIRCLFQRNCTQCNDGSSTLNSHCSWWSRIVEITSIKFEWRKRENYQRVHLQIVACPNIFWYIPFAFRVISFARFFLHLQRSNVGTTFPPLARFGSNSWLPWLSLAFLLVSLSMSLFFNSSSFQPFSLAHTHFAFIFVFVARISYHLHTHFTLRLSMHTNWNSFALLWHPSIIRRLFLLSAVFHMPFFSLFIFCWLCSWCSFYALGHRFSRFTSPKRGTKQKSVA